MGISGISPWSLLLILLIVALLFGTKRLRNIGKDLGEAMKSFRSGAQQTTEQVDTKEKQDDKEVGSKEKIEMKEKQDATETKSNDDKNGSHK